MANTAMEETIRNTATEAMLPSTCPMAGPIDKPPQIPDERKPSAWARRLSGATLTADATQAIAPRDRTRAGTAGPPPAESHPEQRRNASPFAVGGLSCEKPTEQRECRRQPDHQARDKRGCAALLVQVNRKRRNGRAESEHPYKSRAHDAPDSGAHLPNLSFWRLRFGGSTEGRPASNTT